MKRLCLLVVATLFSVSANAAPPANSPASKALTTGGNPFVALQTQIDTLTLSVTNLEQRVTVTEQNIASLQQTAAELQAQISSNTGDISSLQTQLTATNEMIYQLTTELNQTKAVLAKKQNIVNGVCPEGEYVAGINNDGSLICRVDAGSSGMVRYEVSRAEYLQECTIFNPDCGHVPADTLVATCPQGSVVTGGGYTVGPWIGVSSAGISGNGYAVSAALAPIAWFGGGEITVQANCIGLK